MKLSSLPQFARNARRLEQIIRILAKYGLADWIKPEDFDFISSQLKGPEGETLAALSRPERVRMALTELGTTFIKLGQMLSTRADLVGDEVAKELVHLQSNTPADPPNTVRATVEKELGRPVGEIFASFDDTPVASASIAQAHLATTNEGTPVIVKVQHKGIEEVIINDLDILLGLAELLESRSTELVLYQPRATVLEFRRNLLDELDFQREARNLLQFRENFAADPTVHIPEPFSDLSARRVLTMEKLNGISIARLGELEDNTVDRKELAKRGVNIYLEMVFRDRFYHADPHPGNILVLPDNVIGLLDFGMVGFLDAATREAFEGLLEGLMLKDGGIVTENALRIGQGPPDLDCDHLQADIEVFIAQHLSGSIKDMDVTRVFSTFTGIIRQHHIVMKPGISLILKLLIMLEGTARLLDPSFKLAELLQPYHRKHVERKLSPKNLLETLRKTYREWDALLKSLPRDYRDIVGRFRKGTLDVHLEHRKLDTVINRVTYGVVTAAVFLGSTLLWANNIPPMIGDFSLPGTAGTGFALVLTWHLFKAIKKSGGL